MSYIAPAGTPVNLRDLLALAGGVTGGGPAAKRFAAWTADRLGARRAWLFSSGRAGLTTTLLALRNLARDDARDEVLLPAYTCYSVAAAVIRAGLRPRLCDLDPVSLDYDGAALARTDTSATLAILSANLYGIPNDLVRLERFAAERGIPLIDDAAQALGARFAGRPVGGFGDAGMISFEKGKNITTMQGGAVVARSTVLIAAIDRAVASLPACGPLATAITLAKLSAYSWGMRPAVYDLIRRLPGLGLGLTTYDPDFVVARYPGVLAPLALRMAERLDSLNAARRHVAGKLQSRLGAVRGVRLPVIHAAAEPVYARLPCFVEAGRREACLAALDAAGVGATASYPRALCDVPALRRSLAPADLDMPGARCIAETILTLPTHAYCPQDLDVRIAEALEKPLQQGNP